MVVGSRGDLCQALSITFWIKCLCQQGVVFFLKTRQSCLYSCSSNREEALYSCALTWQEEHRIDHPMLRERRPQLFRGRSTDVASFTLRPHQLKLDTQRRTDCPLLTHRLASRTREVHLWRPQLASCSRRHRGPCQLRTRRRDFDSKTVRKWRFHIHAGRIFRPISRFSA